MTNLSEDESTRMYSWWWDSHISPKNSKWLQENLTDMDAKVKAMIKVIEEDADSFAQRAEMYYKKRPELMKLVEEFYRAYRALAERYDNATCVIRQAHQTMAEAFPNQVPLVLTDDLPASSASDTDPHTPDTSITMRAMIDHDDYAASRKGMKELNDLFGCGDNVKFGEGKVRRGLNFDDVEGKESEEEILILKEAQDKLEAEKEDGIIQYHQSLERLSNLEREISRAQEDSRGLEERASKAEAEVDDLKQSLAKLTKESERVNGERDNGVAKLKESEERCVMLEKSNHSLQSELESMELKMGTQNQELTEKNKELGRLQTCLQEERLRFVEAETAFQTLQNLHSQAQEELRHLDLEIKNRTQIFFREMENRYKSLKDEVSKVEEENKNLNGLNLASSISMKDMQDEIFRLREKKGELEEEVELRVDQRNALQQELYCLKEELNELRDENSNLKETCERERSEKVDFLEKLEIMERLMEKNTRLENSISDLSDELEGIRGKVKALEESSQSLLEEKSTLVGENATLMTQLHVTTKILEKFSENNTFLENSLSDAHDELEVMKEKSKSLEYSYRLLDDEKSGLINHKEMLFSQLNFTQQKLEELEKSYKELEEKYSCLEREKKTALCKVEELQVYLDAEKNEHVLFTELSETQIRVLQEEDWHRKREYEEELNKDMDSQIEILVLQRCVQDLEENNLSLLGECQKLLEESKYSEKLISELRSKVRERDRKEELLTIQVENLQGKLLDFRRVYKNSQEQNSKAVEGKRSMMKEFLELEEKTCTLEKENGDFEEKLRTTERKFEAVEMENFHLKERLRKSEEKLKAVESVCYQLSYDYADGKDMFLRKEMELSEVEKKLIVTENKKSELQKIVEDLKRECDEVEMIRKNQEKQIIELSEENGNFSEENGWLCEEKRKLEVELNQLWEENEERKNREESLCSELQKRKNESDQWEIEDPNRYKDMDIELLKQKVSTLEGENGGLKAHLVAYFPTIVSLRDCISSLESQLCLHSELRKIGNEGTKDAELVSSPHSKSCSSEGENIMAPNAFSDLQDLQTKVKDIEKAVIEMEKNIDVNAKLDAAMRQIEELKSKSRSLHINGASEISEKHIMLDQMSDCSYHVENDSQILELWETADQNGSIDLTVKKKENKNSPSSEVLVENELAMDKSEISKISTKTRQEDNKRKVLERLNSDAQKLTNLRITVQDLKRKVEITEKTKNGKSIVECDSVKGQLEEFEEVIQKLFDHNGKLTKNYEKLAMESGESGSFRRKRVSDQARRVSEKIGRLQLEVQKIQFFLVKLDDEKERNGKTRIAETKRRVLLRDYLYGGVVRTSYRRKKAPCCGCVQLPTKG